jgi:hypothetical protein
VNPADQAVRTLGGEDLAVPGVVPDEAGLGEHHRQEDRDQHLPPRLSEHGERSPAGGQQHQVQADLEAVVDRPPPEQARPLHRPRQLRVVASGTGGGQRSRHACTARGPHSRVCGQPVLLGAHQPVNGRADARRNEPAADPRPQVLACRGTVDQTAWTWSACGPLGPWLAVYSTFWFSARVR